MYIVLEIKNNQCGEQVYSLMRDLRGKIMLNYIVNDIVQWNVKYLFLYSTMVIYKNQSLRLESISNYFILWDVPIFICLNDKMKNE